MQEPKIPEKRNFQESKIKLKQTTKKFKTLKKQETHWDRIFQCMKLKKKNGIKFNV